MAKKKQKQSKVQFLEDKNNLHDEKDKMATELEPLQEETVQASDQAQADSNAPQPTVSTSTQSTKKTAGSVRSVCAMSNVVKKKGLGKKVKVQYNEAGIPIGDTRHTLQSYIGMLARSMVPIDIPSWREVDTELKNKLWADVQDTFNVPPQLEKIILQSAGTKWRQFKATLTTDYVIPYVGQRKKLSRPPKQYHFVERDAWKRFVAVRTTDEWLKLNKKQSEIVRQRKYPHRMSRKGYIGLQEEEVNSGRLEPGEVVDRAVLWKKARKPKDPNVLIDDELVKMSKKIDSLIEMKCKGEFKPSGSSDVLTTALETPEHGGRVRGVGSFITPSMYFNMPKDRRNRVTKDELLARDKKREEEFERRTEEFEKKTDNLIAEIAELKALINASSLHSPILSDKGSCREVKEREEMEQQIDKEIKVRVKPTSAKELLIDDDCVAIDIDPIDPSPTEKMGPRKCELAVDNIDNKVAFGVVFDDGDMAGEVHGVPLKSGFLRVSVDGVIKPNALVPVPVAGEIEMVHQAVGSYLAWPRELIIFATTIPEKNRKVSNKGELQRMKDLFSSIKPKENVPARFRLMYKHASCFMKESGASIQIPCDVEVFGIERTIFLLSENITSLLEFEMIGQAIISTYMAYLHNVVRDGNQLEFSFIDPSRYKLNAEFETYLVQRLKDGVLRVNLMPFNVNFHWILVVIWESEIFTLNPLPHPTHFPELEKALLGAVRSFDAQMGRVNKNLKVTNLAGSPKQPGGHECGYVVMRYMKDIIEDKEIKFVTKWAPKNRKCYKKEELDVVRMETLYYIEEFM